MYERSRGFTLTELVITIAVIALLSAIAIPSYSTHIQRSHRNDAKTALLRIAAEQEKYYIQNNTYGTLAELDDPHTERGWYTITIDPADATTFTATATADAGEAQKYDEDCKTFSIDAEGSISSTNKDGDDSTDLCW